MQTDWRKLMLFSTLLGGMGQGMVAPLMPELLSSSESMSQDAGLSATLMYLGIFISTRYFGKWSDRGLVHVLLSVGLFAYAVVLVFFSLQLSLAQLLILRFVEGIALCAVFVGADFVLARQSSDETRSRWMSYYGVALSIGLLLGPILSLSLPGKSSFYGVALLALICAIATAFRRVDQVLPNSKFPDEINRGALVLGSCYGFLEAGMVAVLPILAVQYFLITPQWLLVGTILIAAVSSLAWGELAEKIGNQRVVYILIKLYALAPLLYLLATGYFAGDQIGKASAVLFGVLAGGLYPIGFAWLVEGTSPSHYGFASGAFSRAYGLGSLFGPVVCGLSSEYLGARGFYGTTAVVGLSGYFAISFFTNKRRSHSS